MNREQIFRRRLKPLMWLFFWASSIPLVLLSAGCVTKDVSKPASGHGYGLVVYWSGFIHKSRQIEVHYWDEGGKETAIWRELSGSLKSLDDVALFTGDVYEGPPSYDQKQSRHIFAVQGAAPPADITDDVILLDVKANETNVISEIPHRAFAFGSIHTKNNEFQLEIGDSQTHRDTTLELTRAATIDLIRAVKEKGHLTNDPGWGTPYYKRDVAADLNK